MKTSRPVAAAAAWRGTGTRAATDRIDRGDTFGWGRKKNLLFPDDFNSNRIFLGAAEGSREEGVGGMEKKP
jgi:hypothetical protein